MSNHRSPLVSSSDQAVLQNHPISQIQSLTLLTNGPLRLRRSSWRKPTGVCQRDLFSRPIIEVSPNWRCKNQGEWPAGSDDEGVEDGRFLV